MMSGNWLDRMWRFFLISALAGSTLGGASNVAFSQIVPDSTLGAESSKIITNSPINGIPSNLIGGGAIRMQNLFHSFAEFNVEEGRGAYFINPNSIENILIRVTGINRSNILGTLGVQGSANLFLLNPNGILFGPNARLDVAGSFVASTANSLVFDNGFEFSATNPEAPPLLTIKITPGLQYGTQQPRGAIASTGNLAAGQDLTLLAGNLDLQGQLYAGGNLTLLARDTVKVRDSAVNPFIASANGRLLVQGDRSVDIFALNHPDSGLFSGGDMVLRSPSPVIGDAHYWSGGSFQIEQLDGSLGDMLSPNDPIVFAIGDVRLGNYTGASLHVLAGGSVTLGSVRINGTGTRQTTINPRNTRTFNGTDTISSLAGFSLSDGTSITIDGNSRPTLDVRAGIDWTTFPGGTPGNTTIGTVRPLPTFAGATRGDITVNGNIRIAQPNGVVLLTNQYRASGLAGDIRTRAINTSTNNTSNGGAIALDSRGSIFTGHLDSSSRSVAGNAGEGGRISLIAGMQIKTGNLFSVSNSTTLLGATSNGGTIRLWAGGDLVAGNISSSSFSNFRNSGNGGAIDLRAGGSLITGNLLSSSTSRFGRSGNGAVIDLQTKGSLTTGNLNSYSSGGVQSASGGAIKLDVGGSLSAGNLDSSSSSAISSGNGGAIDLNVGGNLSAGNLNSSSNSFSLGRSGNGGRIGVRVGGDSTTSRLNSSSLGRFPIGNGGEIDLQVGGNLTTGSIDSSSFFSLSQSGNNGGAIALTAINGRITIEDTSPTINASGRSGGNITITSLAAAFSLQDGLISSNAFNALGEGNGGNLRIEAESVDLSNTDLTTTSSGRGNAGRVTITADGSVSLDRSRIFTSLEPGATGTGGDIRINAGSITLTGSSFIDTATFGQGDAGNVFINADGSVRLDNNSAIFSITAGIGDGGDVEVKAGGAVQLTNRSNISTAVNSRAIGDGGDITIEAPSVSLTGGSQLQALTRGRGDSGKITINASDDITVSGIGSDGFLSGVFTSSERNSEGKGGNIEVNTNSSLLVAQGAVLNAQTSSHFEGGDITVNANTVELRDGGQLLTSTSSSGQAGDITVNATQSVLISGVSPNGVSPSPLLRNIPVTSPTLLDEKEPNDSIAQAQVLDDYFSLDSPDDVNSNVEFSTRIPYISLSGKSDSTVDYYSFKVTKGTRVIFDIDTTARGGAVKQMFLLDSNGRELASNRSAPRSLGAGGSTNSDPYLRYAFTEPGTYLIRVEGFSNGGVSAGRNYTLQVSLETPNVTGSVVNSSPASGLFARTEGAGAAGNVTINTSQLTVRDRAQVSASTASPNLSGVGGNLTVNATQFVDLSEGASLSAQSTGAAKAGNLIINTGELTVRDGARVAVSGEGTGDGGNLEVSARSILLDNQGELIAKTASGEGGNIQLDVKDLLLMRRNSLISAEAGGTGNGGNIDIDAELIVAVPAENSDIVANAFKGRGGNINITTQGIFGIEFREQRTPLSDITASSDFGLDGVVNINTPDIDPSRGLANLPSEPVNPQLDQRCQGRGNQATSRFVNTGRSGLPLSPDEISSNTVWEDLRSPTAGANNSSDSAPMKTSDSSDSGVLVEAQGWVKLPDGRIILMAQAPTATLYESWKTPANCPKP